MRRVTSTSCATRGSMSADTPSPAVSVHRRRAPFYVLLALGALMMYANRADRHMPVHCDIDRQPGADTVVMLSASWCGYCRRARAWLQDERIDYCEYDVETTATGRAMFDRAPARVIPIIMIRGDTLVGFDRVEVAQSLAAHGITEMPD